MIIQSQQIFNWYNNSFNYHTVFILINGVPVQEYQLLRRCLFPEKKTIIVIETALAPYMTLYITSFHCYIYDLLKQVCTECNIFNYKAKAVSMILSRAHSC